MATVTNPLSGLVQGMLEGRELGMRMRREALAQREAEQLMTARDIQNRMLLEEHARPVSDLGTVTSDYAGEVPAVRVGPAQFGAIEAPAYTRRADRSRTVQYGGQAYELLTPEEQVQRQADRQRIALESTGIPIDTSRSDFARQLGVSGTVYVSPEHFAQYLAAARYGYGLDPRLMNGGNPEPAANRGSDGPPVLSSQEIMGNMLGTAPGELPMPEQPKIPMAALPSFVRMRTSEAANQTRRDVAAEGNQTRRDIAEQGNQARTSIADKNRTAANQRATERNAASIENAKTREAAGAGRGGAQNAMDTRRMDAVVKEENGYHQQRSDIGAQLANGTDKDGAPLNDGRRRILEAQYRSATDSLQNAQFRKAKIMKAQEPPRDVITRMPEGKQVTSPDGHVWQRQGGVVYIVK